MDEASDDRLESLAGDLRAADRAVALTGAGVSAASGIPTFRGEDGVWGGEFDPDDFRYDRFRRDPAGFWRDRLELHETMFAADPEPNAAHRALADLAADGPFEAVLTQNTDGLHAEAGGTVVELHGNARRVVCPDCSRTADATSARERARDGELPPRCESCDGALKPDVILFGERLPGEALAEARRLATAADVFLAVGSSLTVDPAASLPRECDGTLAVVNYDRTRHDDRAEYVFREDVTELLPHLVSLVAGDADP
ncbi:NAD-dependent protein deacetylase [Halorarum halophilum]|uniref:NAD-dependent protein deacetylase n=1 Tax=Halorarum halophilum TaxID=2743090 RepID=A0A7D5KLM8_9EURY|nr:Sir2 family NAD-dependent protein deacetylase [Halobaculum halophilum]QLG26962.1 NAD-dependent protein deacetylase [Halobaculum halophilum]